MHLLGNRHDPLIHGVYGAGLVRDADSVDGGCWFPHLVSLGSRIIRVASVAPSKEGRCLVCKNAVFLNS